MRLLFFFYVGAFEFFSQKKIQSQIELSFGKVSAQSRYQIPKKPACQKWFSVNDKRCLDKQV